MLAAERADGTSAQTSAMEPSHRERTHAWPAVFLTTLEAAWAFPDGAILLASNHTPGCC